MYYKEIKRRKTNRSFNIFGESKIIWNPSLWSNLIVGTMWFTIVVQNAVLLRAEGTPLREDVLSPEVCTTKVCIKVAERVKKWTNMTESPCDNFYQFACGGWLARKKVPRSLPFISEKDRQSAKVTKKIRRLLQSSNFTTDSRLDKLISKTQKFYRSCLNYGVATSAKTRLLQIFSFVPLPYINGPQWNKRQLESIMADLQVLKINLFMMSNVEKDTVRKERHLLRLVQPMDFYDFLYAKAPVHRSALKVLRIKLVKEVLQQVMNDLNISNIISNVTVEATAAVNLEMKIVNALIPLHELNSIHTWNTSKFQSIIQNFNLTAYLNRLAAHESPGRSFTSKDELLIVGPTFFRKLNLILAGSDVKVAAGNLAIFRLVQYYCGGLPRVYENMFKRYERAFEREMSQGSKRHRRHLKGIVKRYKRQAVKYQWQSCANSIKKRRFTDIVARLYSQKYFTQRVKRKVMEAMVTVRSKLVKRMTENKWIGEAKSAAIQRLRNMKLDVGFPDYIYDTDYLEKKYGSIPVGDDLFWNLLRYRKHERDQEISLLWQPVDLTKWDVSPLTVHVKDETFFNRLHVPMASITVPYFKKNYPEYLNYGGIYMIIANRIIRSFIMQGKVGDKWWPTKTQTAYNKDGNCLRSQYRKYGKTIYGRYMNVNGDTTLDANVADEGSLKVAFDAYKALTQKRRRPDMTLPGLKFTTEQLFYINYGQTYCMKLTERGWAEYLLGRAFRSPPNFRIIGTLSNSEDFQKTFQCEKMNSSNICSMW